MMKKHRFPLEMEEGVKVNSLEELRDKFSLERVLGYLSDDKLIRWLRDRYIDEIADEIEKLDRNDNILPKRLCEILDVKYDEEYSIDIEAIEERNRKIKCLKEYTDDKKYVEVLDNIVFSQDDLYDLLDLDKKTIYLCGEKFIIPISRSGVSYIGINNPEVVINSKEEINWEERNIVISNVRFDSKYQQIISKEKHREIKDIGVMGGYFKNSYLNFMLSNEEIKNSERCYNKIAVDMNNLAFYMDKDIINLKKLLLDIEVAGMAEKYIEKL